MSGIIGQTTHLAALNFIILSSKYLNTLHRKVVASIGETSIASNKPSHSTFFALGQACCSIKS